MRPPASSDATHKSRLSPGVLSDLLQTGGAMTLASGSINLLEMLTELKEAFHSLGHRFIIKRWLRDNQTEGMHGARSGVGCPL